MLTYSCLRTQSIITLVFFITYIIFQPPATVLTRKIGPRIFLAGLCIAWGTVMIGMGFTHNWAALAACRVILGLLEAGFFPVSGGTGNQRSLHHLLILPPGLRLLAVDMVRPLRHGKAILGLLSPWRGRFCLQRYSRLWSHADEGLGWFGWMEVS